MRITPLMSLASKLAHRLPAITNTRHRPADAPVAALPGHRRGRASSGAQVERAALPQPPITLTYRGMTYNAAPKSGMNLNPIVFALRPISSMR